MILIILVCSITASAEKPGRWLNTTADTKASRMIFFDGASNSNDILLTEDYEVLQTHEICASITGYFLEKSDLGRYAVNFKGMRTSATFVFTTQDAAEKWVERFCTPESLTSIKAGHGSFSRSY